MWKMWFCHFAGAFNGFSLFHLSVGRLMSFLVETAGIDVVSTLSGEWFFPGRCRSAFHSELWMVAFAQVNHLDSESSFRASSKTWLVQALRQVPNPSANKPINENATAEIWIEISSKQIVCLFATLFLSLCNNLNFSWKLQFLTSTRYLFIFDSVIAFILVKWFKSWMLRLPY